MFEGDDVWLAASRSIDVVEAVGAGDAYAAGLLSCLLVGGSPEAALAAGHDLAAQVLGSMSDYAEDR